MSQVSFCFYAGYLILWKYFMMKVVYFLLLFTASFMVVAEAPQTVLNINESNFERYVNKEHQPLDEPVIIAVAPSVLAGQPNVNVGVMWDSCKPLNGSSGFNISITGFRDKDETHDSYEFSTEILSFHTKVWMTLEEVSSSPVISKTQSYECDVLGTRTWPSGLDNQPIARLIINIDVPPPSCSISVPKTITVPPVSKKNPQSTIVLPVQLTCEKMDVIHYVPDVSLTLTSDADNSNGHLLEDDSLVLKMLYGSDVPTQEGNEWAADGDKKYPVGQMDGQTKNVTPVIQATIKEGAVPEVRKINATLTINFS
ncbi:hypothetical protein [Yersinia ruckeri]|uniref:hypothetical protein n=2 Tax=Yersinia ruckeri TaxID=29486 RepID=UPI0008FD9F13|nr:hypothetical protein [Yersinia ruckeri]ELM3739081.1 hypothetical protein [Yersinia ruckeri]MCK8540437.1 hypothetical protein [Yersinia ruckeri]MCK8543755.1 hypothetical protein [Yersinia ruckeri]MCK8553335.1 hypothetical protein [Yersinia ruckeri]MCK8572796.1 hypothetical protein [Yersinia ruckeri]